MVRINIICEGQTEESFVVKVLYPYLIQKNILVTPRNIGTGSSYGKLKFNVIQWLKQDVYAYVTTLIDVYGMGGKYPGYVEAKQSNGYSKVKILEEAFKSDIDGAGLSTHRFIPHFQLHEFEAMLFSDCVILEELLSLDYEFILGEFQKIKDKFDSPEHINDSPLTAPSKRILGIVSSYDKVLDGILIAEEISIDKIRAECKHFDQWLIQLEKLK